MTKFVIQEHHARSHHFDFRLEKDGVFKSWAIPKGVPDKPGIRRLAIQVEDHALAFGEFEGSIPKGQYGAGSISIWDQGNCDLKEWSGNEITFTLHGQRVNGLYAMTRFSDPASPTKWLLAKKGAT